MSIWYYSDTQRQQQGPISTDELTALHHQGTVTMDTLVWRDGMPDWKPWREVMADVVSNDAMPGAAVDMTANTTVGTATDSWAIPEATGVEASPYTPPKALLSDSDQAYLAGGRVVYAGFLKRFAGLFIDNLVGTAISYAIIIPMFMLLGLGAAGIGSLEENPMAGGMVIMTVLAMYAILFTLPSLYYGWMQCSSTQATLGKMAVGIKIVRSDGSRIGFWRGFLRHFAQLLLGVVSCGLGSLVSAVMTAVTERKQALHDMICDTVVVDKYAFTANSDLQKDELGTAAIVILVISVLFVVGILALYGVFIAMSMDGRAPF